MVADVLEVDISKPRDTKPHLSAWLDSLPHKWQNVCDLGELTL